MLNKIYIFLLFICVNLQITFANVKPDLKDQIIPVDPGKGILSSLGSDTNGNKQYQLDAILQYVRDSIFGLLGLIAIGVFLYIGFKLISARGNPEEFKKALNTLIYAVIGIFIVSFAWAAVRLVAGLNIS